MARSARGGRASGGGEAGLEGARPLRRVWGKGSVPVGLLGDDGRGRGLVQKLRRPGARVVGGLEACARACGLGRQGARAVAERRFKRFRPYQVTAQKKDMIAARKSDLYFEFVKNDFYKQVKKIVLNC